MNIIKLLSISTLFIAMTLAADTNAQVTPAPTQPTPAPSQPTPAPTQPTPAPSQPTPAPTQPTPAPTQPTPAPSQPTPAPTQPTPAPSQPTPAPTRSCWGVSVEYDATYCIDGPICSGKGTQPAGWNCPKKGAVAIADCHNYLSSYTNSTKCVAPIDAECRVIKTGAWGCVWPGQPTPAPTPASTKSSIPTPAPTAGKPTNSTGVRSGDWNTTAAPPSTTKPTASNDTITVPVKALRASTMESATTSSGGSSSGSSGATIGAIAAVAGVACVAAGAAFYRQQKRRNAEAVDLASAIDTPPARRSAAPHTPPIQYSSKFFGSPSAVL
ncbi:hypothetical protein Poli38472_012018 [Pythium oligandrum]|uniref:Uncharacterized protein n=1 Tax=Pythium oligandrum TaxID=41045 RepID=A0A8K1FPG9_PYTOL|nr:hypothetical protein Poli38472_012018 [Pythium oligandrum]|eukprot:TMW66902.1 hypothetical protein Poli38472_012018 [Pythium oligandrum]